MAETQRDESDTTDADDLHNRVVDATFNGRKDDSYIFGLDNGETALVDPDEFEGEAPWSEGDEMEILIEGRRNGDWTASARKVGKLEMWDALEEARKNQKVIEGDILEKNKGGLSVDIGLRAFLPRSHVALHQVDDCGKFVGRHEKFTIIKFDKKRCNVVVSRRKVLEQEREEEKQELLDSIKEGEVFTGTVRNLKPYGAFVDIGGVDGLLHISNISWQRIDHPSEVLEPGDEVEVEVLEYDREDERLSLGRKQLLDDPWDRFEDEHEEGDIIDGEVVSLADFGAFVEIAEGLEGLVHVTELSWTDRTNHPGQVLDVGDEVEVKIIDIDPDERRVGLSIKQLEPNPWEEITDQIEVGEVIEGEVTSITDFGMFVQVAPDIEGLVHVSNISWTEEIQDVSNHYEEGEEIEAKVLELDPEAKRIGLGIKQLSDDPWSKAEEKAVPGEKIEATVTKLTDFGAFAEVVEGVEGLIHISELSKRRIDHPREVVRPGEDVEPLVLEFDRQNERIGLSLKQDQLEEEASEYQPDEDAASTQLGDVIGEQLGGISSAVEEDEASDEDEQEDVEASADTEETDEGEQEEAAASDTDEEEQEAEEASEADESEDEDDAEEPDASSEEGEDDAGESTDADEAEEVDETSDEDDEEKQS